MPSNARAVFLDRDGVINSNAGGYPYKIDDLEILPGVPQALKNLKGAGYLLIVITNQSGIARGYFSVADMEGFHNELQNRLMESVGTKIDQFYFCPHHRKGSVEAYSVECLCRKPKPGNLLKAIEEHSIDPSKSFFVGDRDTDIACAVAANVEGIQIIATGEEANRHPQAVHTADSLEAASQFILSRH